MQNEPRISLPRKKKIALCLSGGGTKAAAYHIGVAHALREHGFDWLSGLTTDQNLTPPGPKTIQTLVGSSGGSFIAAILAAGYSLENINASFLNQSAEGKQFFPKALPKLTYKKMFKIRPEIAKEQASSFLLFRNIIGDLVEGRFPSLLQLKWLKMTGFFSASGFEQFLREEVLPVNRFQDLRSELFIVATHLNDSRKVIFGKKEYLPPPHDPRVQYFLQSTISDAVSCSASLPVVFAPFLVRDDQGEEHYLMDGEIRETLSTHVAVDAGADLVITSYTHQPYRYSESVGSLTKLGLPAIIIQAIYTLIEQKINTSRESYLAKKSAMNAVFQYLKESEIEKNHIQRVMEILEQELHQKRDIDILPIHPDPSDTKMFLGEHLTLNPKKLREFAKAGYKAGMTALAKYEFTS